MLLLSAPGAASYAGCGWWRALVEQARQLGVHGYLSKALYDEGLYCRADDRGDPVIQLAPPLICDQEHFDEIEQILRVVLDKAATLL